MKDRQTWTYHIFLELSAPKDQLWMVKNGAPCQKASQYGIFHRHMTYDIFIDICSEALSNLDISYISGIVCTQGSIMDG